jgi:glycosyltransferase involved in cell wall biosynthesis
MSTIKLSICIATFNRAMYIDETLESLLGQLTSEVELVIVDGASSDNTKEVIAKIILRFPQIRYIREAINSGIDADYDKAVGYATGEYCWLMTDDDLLKPDAIKRVLTELDGHRDLVIVNAETRSSDLTHLLAAKQLVLNVDKSYKKKDVEIFFIECINYLSFIGSVVVRRKFWLERDRRSFYGTLFIHVGVIFQQPSIENIYVISDPQLIIRYGNAMWTPRGFEIWCFIWPQLVWSFKEFCDEAKREVWHPAPWKSIKTLLCNRAIGCFSKDEFKKFIYPKTSGIKRYIYFWISRFPGSFINIIVMFYFAIFNRTLRIYRYDLLRSPYATKASRLLANLLWK